MLKSLGGPYKLMSMSERMKKKWDSPVYALYEEASVVYRDGRRGHAFKCRGRGCKATVFRYLDTKDHSSSSNLWRHARLCWGKETVDEICAAVDLDEARTKIVAPLLRDGSITQAFQRKKPGVTYSHRPHTKIEVRTEIVRWVAEDLRPYQIVKDRGLLSLLKTGRPGYYVPSPSTVARDVKVVFVATRNRVALKLQVSGVSASLFNRLNQDIH